MMASVDLSSFWIFKAGGVVTDADSATWRITDPDKTDLILWDSGANEVDGLTIAARPQVSEWKFNFVPPPAPPAAPMTLAPRTLTGISYADAGPAGTTAFTTGGGSSTSVPGVIWGTNWKCSWNLRIGVTPGAPAAAVSYDVKAEADDPITLHRDEFADNTSGKTSLYLPVSMSGLTHGEQGSGGMSVAYVTDTGRVELLNLTSSEAGVDVTGDEPDFLSLYVVSDPNDNPMAKGHRPYSQAELRDVLAASMKGGVQRHSLLIGLLLENIPVPTIEIGEGDVVGEVHTSSRLSEVLANGEGYEQTRQREVLG